MNFFINLNISHLNKFIMNSKLEIPKTLTCTDCGIEKTFENYGNDYRGKYGKKTQCYNCAKKHRYLYTNTFEGFINKLVGQARGHSIDRKNKGRNEAGIFNITKDDLLQKWNEQDGLCFYSGIKMITKQSSDYMCSLERLNPEKGYIIENVALIIYELNNPTQWTPSKIRKVIELVNVKHDFDKILKDIDENAYMRKQTKKMNKLVKTIKDNIEYWKCTHCSILKTTDAFDTNIARGCKECTTKNTNIHLNTLKGHLNRLINNAKMHINRINKTRKDNPCDFNITYDDLLEQLKKQKGLCYYSSIKMEYGKASQKDFVMSLERIDSLKGYVKDNICLICREFNGSDQTARTVNTVYGSGAWTKEKFQVFLKSIQEKYKNYKDVDEEEVDEVDDEEILVYEPIIPSDIIMVNL